jgi:magnesium chelatase subunit I
VARELVRSAVSSVFAGYFPDGNLKAVCRWFDQGGALSVSDTEPAESYVTRARQVPDLVEALDRLGLEGDAAPVVAAGIDFVLEGLHAQKRISRSDERGYHGTEQIRRPQPEAPREPVFTPEDDEERGRGNGRKRKKNYYN